MACDGTENRRGKSAVLGLIGHVEERVRRVRRRPGEDARALGARMYAVHCEAVDYYAGGIFEFEAPTWGMLPESIRGGWVERAQKVIDG